MIVFVGIKGCMLNINKLKKEPKKVSISWISAHIQFLFGNSGNLTLNFEKDVRISS